jgi:thiosulfate/3-mercaptopyruvate sulfurtransferase
MKMTKWYLMILCLLVPAMAGLAAVPAPAAAADTASSLVTTEWLQKNLNTPGLVIIDVRTGANYGFAHIPGAVSAPYLQNWEPWNKARQCQLMPTPKYFTGLMRYLGVNNSSHVVIYDHGNTANDATMGGAAVWIMEAMGHASVSYLDGGFTKWTFEGRLVDNKDAAPTPGDFAAKPDASKLATLDEVTENLKTREWLLVDTRNSFQFFGTSRRPDAARYGHLPGALNLPAEFLTNAGINRGPASIKNKEDLEAIARGVGIPANLDTKIITYCNSAQQAGMVYFVLHDLLGYRNVKVFDGSILEYAASLNLPMVKYSWSEEAK